MSSLASCAADIFDRLAECVNGPVLGTVTASALTTTTVLARGQLGTLPDGRVVRCTKSTRIATTGTPVPVRQLFLAPAYPVAKNFELVTPGAVVTWQSPPAGIAPTGPTVGSFAPVAGAALVSAVELEQLANGADAYAAGAQGSALAILLAPEVKVLTGSERMSRRTHVEIAWKLRVNLSTLAGQGQRRAASRDVFDQLMAALDGANVSGSVLWFSKWSLARQADGISSYELALTVKAWMRGRVMQDRGTPQPFVTLGSVTHLDPAGQLPAEQTLADIPIPA